MHSINAAMKPALRPPLQSSRLLDQVRERICYCHYSIRTESAYVYQVRDFARFSGLRHPRELGGPEVQTFLTHLAAQRRVSPSTHRQALCALLFLYREVLGLDLPWREEIGRPKAVVRIPVVLSRDETARLIAELEGTYGVVARLLYGAGLRLLECLRLRARPGGAARAQLRAYVRSRRQTSAHLAAELVRTFTAAAAGALCVGRRRRRADCYLTFSSFNAFARVSTDAW